jgi:CRP/FNR family transcriptional regulator, cyclic AMP receptor protein
VIDASLLHNIPAFQGFDDRARLAVSAMMRLHRVDDGHVLIKQGSRAGGAFALLRGEVRVVRDLPGGRSVDIGSLEEGQLFGLLSCIDGIPRGATVVARGNALVGEVPREAMGELLQGRTTIALRFQVAVCRTLFREVRATNLRLAELAAVPDSEMQTVDLEPLDEPLEDFSGSLEPL